MRLTSMAEELRNLESLLIKQQLIKTILHSLPTIYRACQSAWQSATVPQQRIQNLTVRLIGEDLLRFQIPTHRRRSYPMSQQNISNSPSIPNNSLAEVSGKRGADKGKSLKAVMQTATVSTVSNSESLEKDMVAPEDGNCQMLGERVGLTLYLFAINLCHNIEAEHSEALPSSISPILSTWHRRLAHVSYNTIIKMASSGAVDGLDLANTVVPSEPCTGCAYGKHQRQQFPVGRIRATCTGNLIRNFVNSIIRNLFDMLQVPLYHAWIPNNPATASLLGSSSYSKLHEEMCFLKCFGDDDDSQKIEVLDDFLKSPKVTEIGWQQIGETMRNGESGVFLSDHLFRTYFDETFQTVGMDAVEAELVVEDIPIGITSTTVTIPNGNERVLESWRQMSLEVMLKLAKTEPAAAAALKDATILKRRVVVVSPNVEIVRKCAEKFYKQRLFAFLIHYASTSCTLKCEKLNGQYRATLTVYGEEEPTIAVASHRGAAEINACIRYINAQVVNGYMTWYI
ncbi:hypothetical protein DAPPUDRAFT_323426 [Daphnia pulex]|uniref:Ubiquitin carboxyl-terminal hydrolase n=1 Tax=Daphnia pulex TaxID=6669 RepID=E9GYU5_DAPPU|nr:hypothetical protein DAPPUDRAFT_323426 [Daphnia pulex]|eukprot:EFX75218.1 hypothetical protein DAPPUDRAFT_323426 [Daphnia pulex]